MEKIINWIDNKKEGRIKLTPEEELLVKTLREKKNVGEWNESFFIQKKIKATIPLHLDYIMFTYEINEQV